jgi:hypothetical protein
LFPLLILGELVTIPTVYRSSLSDIFSELRIVDIFVIVDLQYYILYNVKHFYYKSPYQFTLPSSSG